MISSIALIDCKFNCLIISELINDFNYDYSISNAMNFDKIGNITYDNSIDSYVYLNNRLSLAKSILQDNSIEFNNINFDASETIYRINKILLQISYAFRYNVQIMSLQS